jgi:hypothetical protein
MRCKIRYFIAPLLFLCSCNSLKENDLVKKNLLEYIFESQLFQNDRLGDLYSNRYQNPENNKYKPTSAFYLKLLYDYRKSLKLECLNNNDLKENEIIFIDIEDYDDPQVVYLFTKDSLSNSSVIYKCKNGNCEETEVLHNKISEILTSIKNHSFKPEILRNDFNFKSDHEVIVLTRISIKDMEINDFDFIIL